MLFRSERGARGGPDSAGKGGWGRRQPRALLPRLDCTKRAVRAALADDFDTVRAVDAVMDLVHHGNRQLKAAAEVTPGTRSPRAATSRGRHGGLVDRSPGSAIASRGLSGSQRCELGEGIAVGSQLAPAPGRAPRRGS